MHLLLRVTKLLPQIVDLEVTVNQIHVSLFILFLVFLHVFMSLVVALVNIMLVYRMDRLMQR